MKRAADMFIFAVIVGVISLSQAIASDTNKGWLPRMVGASFIVVHASDDWRSLESLKRLSPIQIRMVLEVESALAENHMDYYSRSALESHSIPNLSKSSLPGYELSSFTSSIIPLSVNVVISGECYIRNTRRGYLAKVELVARDAVISDRLARTTGSHKNRNRNTALKLATRKAAGALVNQLFSNSISEQYTERHRLLVTLPDEMFDGERERAEMIIENACQKIAEHVRAEVLTDRSLQYILFRVGYSQYRGDTFSAWSTLKQELRKNLPEYSCRRKSSVGRFLWIDISHNDNK
ncbi:MAG: hypothetical protein U9N55_00440 [candidate division Zixibacteria bacterium]|nr:hypothetical protein [candidate division Zixibacteria bacterium]